MDINMESHEFADYSASAAISIALIQSKSPHKDHIKRGLKEGIELCKAIQIGSNLTKETFCSKDLDFQFKLQSYTKRIPNLVEYFERADIMQSNLQFILDSSPAPNPESLD